MLMTPRTGGKKQDALSSSKDDSLHTLDHRTLITPQLVITPRRTLPTDQPPTLSPLQEQILTLLRVDLSAYGPIASQPVNSA